MAENPPILPTTETENKLPTIGNPSILPIVPEGGNKLPTIGNPSILPIVPEGETGPAQGMPVAGLV